MKHIEIKGEEETVNMEKKNMKAPDVSIKICGFIAEYDSAGMYPGVELFNLLFSESRNQILPKDDVVLFKKHSLDYARKLVWGDINDEQEKKNIFVGEETRSVLSNLLESLQLEVPNLKSVNSWQRAHFFPYTPSLIHWDARRRSKEKPVELERIYLRGAGAYLYKVLRLDYKTDRYTNIRKAFQDFYSNIKDGSLDQIAALFQLHSYSDKEPKVDLVEKEAVPFSYDNADDSLRDGIESILSHSSISTTTKIYALVRFVAFWLLVTQIRRSSKYTSSEFPPFVIDCGNGPSQIRRQSSKSFKDMLNIVDNAITHCLEKDEGEISKKQRQKTKGFFSASAATIGFVNSFKGKRHFQLGLETLEMLVLLESKPIREIPFESFLDNLYEKWNIVVSRESAEKAGLTEKIDVSIFDDNKEKLAYQLQTAGLLNSYSDATKMITTKELI